MAVRTLSEAVTLSFYAWETRGRGWIEANYPVALEPPFRPFFLIHDDLAGIGASIDDGKRPTFASQLVAGVRSLFAPPAEAASTTAFEEQEPFPALESTSLSVLRLHVPADFASGSAVMAQLLSALSAAVYPVSFELIGVGGQVTVQIVCATFDVNDIAAHVEGYLPEIAVIPGDDRLADAWRERAVHAVIDVGLTHEFFLPIKGARDFHIDPYVPLVSALSRTREGEFLTLQVLFERTRNPWAGAITDALDDGDGGCLIADAEWFVRAAERKIATPLYAAVVRVGAQAAYEERALELIQGTHAFFLQYANPAGNALAPLAHESDGDSERAACLRSRTSRRTGMLLSAEELVGLIHVPDASVRQSALSRLRRRTKALPSIAVGHALTLGDNTDRGVTTRATLDLESRFAHTWIVGGTGTGKSTLLANMVLDDIKARHGVAVFDVHGDLIDDIIARIPEERRGEVILFDPSDVEFPVGFNILRATSEIERELVAADVVAVFRRLATSWGDTMTTVLAEAVAAILAHPGGGTLVELRQFLIDDAFRKSILARVEDEHIRFFWEKEYPVIGARSIGPLLSRLNGSLRGPLMRNIIGQRTGTLDLGTVMQKRSIFLARLPKGQIGEENAYLLGSLLLAKFNQRALMRQSVSREDRVPFFCYADEFQHFVNPSMESLIAEGRKYRFGLVLAHQALGQLAGAPGIESALFANCHTRIAFRVGDDDARKLAQGFTGFDAADLLAQGRGEAVSRIGSIENTFNLKTRALSAVDAAESESCRNAVLRMTRERYAVPRHTLSASRTVTSAGTEKPADTRNVTPARVAQVPTAPSSTADRASTSVSCAPIARRAQEHLSEGAPQTGRGGQMHKYLQHLVKRLAEERGFRASIEAAAGHGQVDVLLEREGLFVGCEISVTTNAVHEIENLRKCLAAGFTRIIFISSERKQREAVAKFIRTEMADARIHVIGPEEVVTALDALGPEREPTESVVRGYKVKVTRQALAPSDAQAKRSAIASVVARAMKK